MTFEESGAVYMTPRTLAARHRYVSDHHFGLVYPVAGTETAKEHADNMR
jgi:hypothetical protein